MDVQNLLSQSTLFTFFPVFLFLYALSFTWRRRRNTKPPPPPEVSGAWPLIGHLHLLGGSQPPHVTLGNLADKYGPIFSIRLGVHKTLVISNSEMAKECFTVNDRAFASRPKSVSFEVLGYNFSMIGLSPYGSYWRHVRKIATLEVLSTHRIETLKHVMESEVETAMKESYNRWLLHSKESGNSQKTIITEMKKWIGDITINVLFRMVVGKSFTTASGSDTNNKNNERIRKVLRDFIDLSGLFIVGDALPFLRWLDLDGREKAMKRTMEELDYFTQIWLQEHKHKRKNLGSDDFMDVLISTVDQEFEGRDADTIVKATSLSLILAGTDTTTGTLTWALSLLLNNREVMNKVIDELDTQIGKERMVLESDFKNLVYLQATIKETLRLYPASPLSLPHESMEDCIVGGYHVPSGTRLLTNLSKIHRDPMIYPDPLEFRPERFLTTHKGIDFKGQHFELIPFGAGRRMCPGLSFGLQMTQLILANLLHGFNVISVDDGVVDMVEQVGLTNIKASPLEVVLTPRLSPQVYGEI